MIGHGNRARVRPAQLGIGRLFGLIHEAVVAIDQTDGRIVLWNPAAERLFGCPADEALGRDAPDLLPAELCAAVAAQAPAHAPAPTGATVPAPLECRIRQPSGEDRWVEVELTTVTARKDRRFTLLVMHDVTERRRATEAQRFLAAVGRLLSESLDYEATLQNVARLAVPSLADHCLVDLLADDGLTQRVAAAHRDPTRARLSVLRGRRFRPDPDGPHPINRVLATGRPQLVARVTEALLRAAAQDEEHLRALREWQLTSGLVVPLVGRGRILGTLMWLTEQHTRPFDEGDLHLAQEVAERAALAIDNARLHQEAQERARRYQELVAGVDAIVWEADARTWQFTFVSEQAEAILGYPAADWLHQSGFWAEHIHPDDRAAAVALCQAATAERRDHEFEYRALAADGRIVFIRDIVQVICDESGQPRWLRGLMLDLTDYKRAEEALRSRETLFRAIFEGAPVGIVLADLTGRPLQSNSAFQRMTGYTDTELRGKHFAEFTYPDDLQADSALAAALVAGERDSYELDKRYVRADGSVFWGRLVVSLIRDDDGAPRFALAIVEDIDEHKQAEEQRELLVRAEKLRALGQMASGVAHDLNQSLGIIAGYSELAVPSLDATPPDLATARESLRLIRQAALDGAETVKRLLTFGRAQPEAPAERVPVDVLLREVALLTAPQWRDAAQAAARPISLQIEAAGELIVLGWTAALREALMNLIFNAVDALPDGGTIHLRARRQGKAIAVEVADSGVGMLPDVQAHVFEPFYTTKGDRGTGLGLAVVFGIVERHGGQVVVESAPGHGTTMRLLLPAARASVDPAPPIPAAPPRPSRALHVLAVDDEPHLARLLARMLKQEGHAADVAASGEAALQRLEAETFDAVFSDVAMGTGINGWELAQRVQARWPALPFVLVTGWGAGIDPADARGKGVSAVLSKPYTLRDVRRVLALLTA